MAIEKYQPSNGTEGDWFMDQFCYKCIKFPHSPGAGNQCKIFLRTCCYKLEDKEYPTEWQRTEDGPVCTAYKSREEFNLERRGKRKRRRVIATDKLSMDLFQKSENDDKVN